MASMGGSVEEVEIADVDAEIVEEGGRVDLSDIAAVEYRPGPRVRRVGVPRGLDELVCVRDAEPGHPVAG